jgi:hypothetical protein
MLVLDVRKRTWKCYLVSSIPSRYTAASRDELGLLCKCQDPYSQNLVVEKHAGRSKNGLLWYELPVCDMLRLTQARSTAIAAGAIKMSS